MYIDTNFMRASLIYISNVVLDHDIKRKAAAFFVPMGFKKKAETCKRSVSAFCKAITSIFVGTMSHEN